jgi:hypothetical protein
MKINWNKTKPQTHPLYFNNLGIKDTFVIDSPTSQGAVYMKVEDMTVDNGNEFMLELETGHIFRPTGSRVKHVDVEINVASQKPSIYE